MNERVDVRNEDLFNVFNKRCNMQVEDDFVRKHIFKRVIAGLKLSKLYSGDIFLHFCGLVLSHIHVTGFPYENTATLLVILQFSTVSMNIALRDTFSITRPNSTAMLIQ